MNKTSKLYEFWCYIVIYLLLLFKAGYVFVELYSAITSMILVLLLIVLLLSFNKPIPKQSMNIILGMLVLYLMSCIIKGIPSPEVLLLFIIGQITALLVVSYIEKALFIKIFANIILVISLCSILLWGLREIGIPIISYFPIITNSNGVSAHFALLTTIWTQGNVHNRIMGIFWEPGAFQVFITFAMLIDLYTNPPILKLRYFIYIVALFFTYSTTGYLSAILVLLLIIARKNKHALIPVLLLILAIFSLYAIYASRLDGFLKYTIVDKIDNVVNYSAGDETSAASRVESIYYPIKYWIRSPLFGLGYNGYSAMEKAAGHSMFVCTSINYLLGYGMILGILCITGILKLLNLASKTLLEKTLLITILVITTISENFAFNPIITCFILYGYHKKTVMC